MGAGTSASGSDLAESVQSARCQPVVRRASPGFVPAARNRNGAGAGSVIPPIVIPPIVIPPIVIPPVVDSQTRLQRTLMDRPGRLHPEIPANASNN